MKTSEEGGQTLAGIDGSNPLGFLAALGTLAIADRVWRGTRLHWRLLAGAWRPVLAGCEPDRQLFLEGLLAGLRAASMKAFDLDGKLPFPVEVFIAALREATNGASGERRDADLLCGFGTELGAKPDAKKVLVFKDTELRMVRSGDSAGQGLPVYAKAMRSATEVSHLQRTLFDEWDYQDGGSSLRWDPIEDQRYALRWRDPSKSGAEEGPGTMIGANALAVEALQLLPTVTTERGTETTGFRRIPRKGTFFSWPIWLDPAQLDTVRSLLALPLLQPPRGQADHAGDRAVLAAMGIAEVFRSQRIQQNQYYSNFAPAVPV